jgi:hypothetical protein
MGLFHNTRCSLCRRWWKVIAFRHFLYSTGQLEAVRARTAFIQKGVHYLVHSDQAVRLSKMDGCVMFLTKANDS